MSTVEFDHKVVPDQQPADDPVLLGVGPDRSVELEALGIPITVETNDPRIERIARQAFGIRRDRADTSFEVRLRLLVHDVPEEPSWRPVQPVLRAQGDYFYSAASRASVVSGDCRTGFAFGFISDRQADHEEHLRSTMVQAPFLWIATNRSLSAIHCAVVTLNGRSISLRGRQSAGKTTLAYAALRQGFSLLCEDVAFAWQTDAGIELRGLPWLLYLKPDAVRFFPELDGLEPLERYNGESKILVPIEEWFPDQTAQTAPIGPTVFVEREPDGRNVLEPIDRSEALERFEATRIAVENRISGGVDVWGTMLEQPAYRFEVGPDPMAAADVLRTLCES
ncbi:MAG: hypothetical protein R3A46_05460 [Thermomicrobiales bacterium]